MKEGHIFILSGYSGAGKNTIINEIKMMNCSLTYIASVTTRSMRLGEQQEEPYCFIHKNEFLNKIEQGCFIEYEEIHGNLYGTLKHVFEEELGKGSHIIKDIDVNGALRFKKIFKDKATLLFIQPSNENILIDRLVKRGDRKEDIKIRMKRIEHERQYKQYFDHVIINDVLHKAIENVLEIVKSVDEKNR